jgi:nucleolin
MMRKREEALNKERGKAAHVQHVLSGGSAGAVVEKREKKSKKEKKAEKKEKKKMKKAAKKEKKKEKKAAKRSRRDDSSSSSSSDSEDEKDAKKPRVEPPAAAAPALPAAPPVFEKKAGFGLQGKGGKALPASGAPKRLGPDPELLRKKREEEDAAKARAKELLGKRRGADKPQDREAKLRAMQEDARGFDEARARQGERDRAAKEAEAGEEEGGGGGGGNKAAFLADMARANHGVGEQATTLGDRISRNKHTNQRGDGGFL